MKKLPRAPDRRQSDSDVIRVDDAESPVDDKAKVAPVTDSADPPVIRGKKHKVSRTKARRFARERALQALYQWDISSADVSDIRKQFYERQEMTQVDTDYFEHIFNGVTANLHRVDAALEDGLDRPLDDVDPIEKAVLRVAVHELLHCPETPARVIINEAIEITKRYGADKGHTYINGVLDRLAPGIRPLEMRRR